MSDLLEILKDYKDFIYHKDTKEKINIDTLLDNKTVIFLYHFCSIDNSKLSGIIISCLENDCLTHIVLCVNNKISMEDSTRLEGSLYEYVEENENMLLKMIETYSKSSPFILPYLYIDGIRLIVRR